MRLRKCIAEGLPLFVVYSSHIRYTIGRLYMSILGLLRVKNITRCGDISKHPYPDEVSDVQRSLLEQHNEFYLLELEVTKHTYEYKTNKSSPGSADQV